MHYSLAGLQKEDELLKDMLNEDKELVKKRKGFLGLW
jgi:hypothetical protein